jgi:hypothetical protein
MRRLPPWCNRGTGNIGVIRDAQQGPKDEDRVSRENDFFQSRLGILIAMILLRSTKGHLNLPFHPVTSSIVRGVETIEEIVVIHNAIPLSTHRIGRSRDDGHTRPVHGDRTEATIDLSSQERIGYVQVLDDPCLSFPVVLPQADAQVGAAIRSQRVKLIRYRRAIQNVAADPRDTELGELSTVKFDSRRPLPLSDEERK